MQSERKFPVVARQEMLIKAPIEKVWRLQSDIEHWHEWQSGVGAAKIEGEVKPGTVFHWKAAGFKIVSTLQIVEPQRSIGWTGKTFGARALDIWQFEATENGTRVIVEDSLWGWMPRLLKVFDQRWLEKSLLKSLEALRIEAERN